MIFINSRMVIAAENPGKLRYFYLDSISAAKFQNCSSAMRFKQGVGGDYQKIDFLKPKFRLDVTPPTKNQPRGIHGMNQQNILKLADSLPAAKKKFWLEILVNDRNDDLV